MKTTRYFDEQVLRKRPYLEQAWCEQAIAAPIRREVQENGRIRLQDRAAKIRYLRVITLDDGETVHNAFFDRNFREDGP